MISRKKNKNTYSKNLRNRQRDIYPSTSAIQSGENWEQSGPSKQELHSQTGLPSTTKPSKYALPWPEHATAAAASPSSAAFLLQLSSHFPPTCIWLLTSNKLRIKEHTKHTTHKEIWILAMIFLMEGRPWFFKGEKTKWLVNVGGG